MALSPIFGAKEGVGVIRECLEKKKTMNGLHSAAAHAVVPPPPPQREFLQPSCKKLTEQHQT